MGPGLRRGDGEFAAAGLHNNAVAGIHNNHVMPAQAGTHASFRARAGGGMERRSSEGFLFFASLLVAVAMVAGPAAAQTKPDTAGLPTHGIRVQAEPIAAFSRNGTPTNLTRLEWRGGLVLSSASKYFGGWSGLVLSEDGTRLLAVSDSGTWMSGEIVYDGSRPAAVRAVRVGALLTLKGKPLSRLRDRDAEAIAIASGTLEKGAAYVAFEQNDRIGVFGLDKDGPGAPRGYLPMPKEARRMRMDGIEALAVLAGGPRKGALVAFAENPLRGESTHRGWIWLASGPRGFTVPGIGGFGVTDAASLPDGSVLLLERRFRWLEGLRVRLRHLPSDALKPGAAVKGEVLLEADNSTAEIDNLEGLAVSRGAEGETVVTLLSDDNFNRFLQRTLLLQFTLKDAATAEVESSAATKP